MAGSLAMTVANEHLESCPVSAVRDQWHQVHFARLFTYPKPSLSSVCPYLLPRKAGRRYGPPHGTWIFTSSPDASLHIIENHSASNPILIVFFRQKILEEHYISKLHFSWPQVSCVPGYPARGIRTLLVSYLDSTGETQKFALRFSTIYEAEAFVNALKVTLKCEDESESPNSNFRSEISSRSEFMSSNRPPSRACEEEELSNIAPVQTYTPEIPPRSNYEVEQPSCTQESMFGHNYEGISPPLPPSFTSSLANSYSEVKILNYEVGQPSCTPKSMFGHNSEGVSPALPPSFTSLMANCCPEVKQAAAQPTVSEEVDLKSQLVKYMEDSSFIDMLVKVEQIINGTGGSDLVL